MKKIIKKIYEKKTTLIVINIADVENDYLNSNNINNSNNNRINICIHKKLKKRKE